MGAVVLAAAALVASFLIVSNVKANADYICTHVIDEASECGNGSWGEWQTLSTSNDQQACTVTTTKRRVYTGTRVVSHILSYLNLRTACEVGYGAAVAGSGGGASGNQGRGGTIVTETSACQVAETQTTRSALTGTGCTSTIKTPVTTTESSQTDLSTNQTTQSVGAVADLDAFRATMIRALIWATPILVHPGERSTLHWQGREVTSCSVAGSNGDGTGVNETGTWTGTAGEQPTSVLSAGTIYTVTCTAFNGTTVVSSTTVGLIPTFQEQ